MIWIIFNFLCLLAGNEALSFDFGQHTSDWYTVNDGVMGGVSRGEIDYSAETMIFSGQLSLENNGGFASVRSPWSRYDLSKYNKVKIRVRGHGGKFALTLQNSRVYYEPTWRFNFVPEAEWQVFEVPLEKLVTTRLGRPMGSTMTREDMEKILRIGIIKSDKKLDEFRLEIDYLVFQ